MTRGILEAQSKMDSAWWSRTKDLEADRDALHAAEVEWQYKFDPYQSQRMAGKFMAGDDDEEELNIATNYIKEDQDVLASEIQPSGSDVTLLKFGNVQGEFKQNDQDGNMELGDLNTDPIEQARQEKLKVVLENRSGEYDRRFKEKQEETESGGEKFVRQFDLPKQFQSTSEFALSMLQDHTANRARQRQRLASMVGEDQRKNRFG